MAHSKKSDIQKLNEKYLKMYKGWHKIYCPAFEKDVYFTNKGWQHIQQEKWRGRYEKEERLKLLGEAKHILGKTTFVQEKRIQNYHGSPHTHYRFTALVGGTIIAVVVIEDKGQLDFLSVFRV